MIELVFKVCEIIDYKEVYILSIFVVGYVENGDFEMVIEWFMKVVEFVFEGE